MDDLTLLALAAGGGDPAALRDFVRAGQADVWRFCAHLGGRGQADDLTQEVYLRVLKALPRFRGDSSARTWLFAIARHTLAHAVGTERRLRLVRESVPGPTTERDPTGAIDIEELVSGLHRDRQVAFVLTQVVGLSYAEAASVCDCPVGTIRSRVARAREDLVAALGQAAAR